MNLLDHFVRRVLARCCAATTMERVVDAVRADTEHERQQALTLGQHWRARWIGICGATALARAVMAQAVHAIATCEPDATRRARQSIWIGVTLSLVSTVLLASLPYLSMFTHHAGNRFLLLLCLLPSALPLGLTVGPVAGACWAGESPHDEAARGGHRRAWKVALTCSVLSLALLGWATPVANQWARESMFPHRLLVPRGVSELTLPELFNVAAGGDGPVDMMPRESQETATLQLHGRAALAVGPWLLTFLAVGVASRVHGAPARLCGGLVALALYLAWWFGVSMAEAPERHHLLAAWTPAVLAVSAGLLMRLPRWPLVRG